MVRFVFRQFLNEGFGWTCLRCSQREGREEVKGRSRIMREGEAESKTPSLSTSGLAQWVDRTKGVLRCPVCGTEEAGEAQNENP